VAAVVDRPVAGGQVLVVSDTLVALETLACWARNKWDGQVVGVTGSAGKTTTKEVIAQLLSTELAVGKTAGNFNNYVGLPLSILRLPAEARVAVLEIGMNHPGEIRHLAGIARPNVGVVTNVGFAHAEFFDSVDGVALAKRELIESLSADGVAVLNADDPHVAAMSAGLEVPVITFGLEHPADVTATAVEPGPAGSDFTLHLPGATPTRIHLPMPGVYNVANALAAAAAAWAAGVTLGDIAAGLAGCSQVPGRAEVIDEGQPFTVVVDFAHNPDALAKVCSLRPTQPGARTIVVFGAEGGKDKGKRPEMGRAARRADFAIVTSDNMPKEEPADVAAQVAAGLQGHPHEIVLDRRQAIARAVALARPGDLVILAGKGHEQTWVFEGQRIPFDDRAVVRELLRELAGPCDILGECQAEVEP
jgi:UDP-N-acetylmuramoyl-tripeptide--D-alanyl-D-alanine ligase